MRRCGRHGAVTWPVQRRNAGPARSAVTLAPFNARYAGPARWAAVNAGPAFNQAARGPLVAATWITGRERGRDRSSRADPARGPAQIHRYEDWSANH